MVVSFFRESLLAHSVNKNGAVGGRAVVFRRKEAARLKWEVIKQGGTKRQKKCSKMKRFPKEGAR